MVSFLARAPEITMAIEAMSLHGRLAVVSGAAGGIGQAIAQKLASEGARLVINDLDADPAHETVEMLKKSGVDAVACVGNVSAPDFAERFIKTAVDNFKGIDIIVNNAGFTWDDVIQKMTDEQWYAILDCHMTAPFRILRAAHPVMKAQAHADQEAGRQIYRKVVNVSSTSALNGNAGQMNYSSAKAGVIGMTRALSREWGRFNVNVNAVAFGLIQGRRMARGPAKDIAIDKLAQVGARILPGVDLGLWLLLFVIACLGGLVGAARRERERGESGPPHKRVD
mgnify:CR=1 FL=1